MTDWTPPPYAKIWIVCAACKYKDFIATGPRHFDKTMVVQAQAWLDNNGLPPQTMGEFDQGFIDQWGRYYSREEALKIVLENGQPFSRDRNGYGDWLFSEGLY